MIMLNISKDEAKIFLPEDTYKRGIENIIKKATKMKKETGREPRIAFHLFWEVNEGVFGLFDDAECKEHLLINSGVFFKLVSDWLGSAL